MTMRVVFAGNCLTYSLLVICPEMTCKTGQMSVRPSVRCQHFQNHKAPRPLADIRESWHAYSMGRGRVNKLTRKRYYFEFRPLRRAGPPRT